VLRRIFGPKRDEVTVGWRKLYNEEMHGLYSNYKVEEDELGGACNAEWGRRGPHRGYW
jgi:hypothetical protein